VSVRDLSEQASGLGPLSPRSGKQQRLEGA
jgi:hypothetical protein